MTFTLIIPLKIEQSRRHCVKPASEYNRPRREAAKTADMEQKLNDI